MYSPSVDPEIRGTFRRRSGTFVSRSAGGFIPCPPYVIASAASRELPADAQLELPEGYDANVLANIRARTGFPDLEVNVSFRQAAELALIGFQLQDLDAEGKLQPPLNPLQKESIGHLIGEVCALNFDGMSTPELRADDVAYIAAAQATIGDGR